MVELALKTPKDLAEEVKKLIEERATLEGPEKLKFCPECTPNAEFLKRMLRVVVEAAERSLEIAEEALEICERRRS